jgi:hypothetical protein
VQQWFLTHAVERFPLRNQYQVDCYKLYLYGFRGKWLRK